MSVGTLPFHREMNIVPSPCELARLQLFIAFPFRFPKRTKERKRVHEASREKAREPENYEPRDYSGIGGEER